MNAIALTNIREMTLVEMENPLITNPDDVLIKVKSIGVCGSDMHYFRQGRIGSQIVQFPFIIGHEFAGEIIDTGIAVKNLKKGDRVAVDPNFYCGECDQCISGRVHTCRRQKFMGNPKQLEGCNKEFVIVPEHNCFLLPDELDFDMGMIIEPLSIGVYASKKAEKVHDKSIAILGYGPIGFCVHQALMARGAEHIYISEILDYRCNIAAKYSPSGIVNPLKGNYKELLMDMEPNQYDYVFDCCGDFQASQDALDLLKPGGTFVLVAIPEFDTWQFSVDKLRHKEITIKNVRRQNNCEEESIRLLTNGTISMEGMITHRFHWTNAQDAYNLVADYRDNVNKTVFYF